MRSIALTVLILAASLQAAPPATAQLAEKVTKPLFEQGLRSAERAVERVFQPRLPRSRAAYPVENYRIEEGKVLTQQEFGHKGADQVGRRCAAAPSMEHNGWNQCESMFDLRIHLK